MKQWIFGPSRQAGVLQISSAEQQRQKCQRENAEQSVASVNKSVWLGNFRASWVCPGKTVCMLVWFRLMAPYVTVKWDVCDPVQTALHYWVWFWALEKHRNFQDGTQTPMSTELEVISCWLHKTGSVDSRPCGSRQIAWLIATCWKRMPALCVHAKMDMQRVNSGACWAWLEYSA